MKFCDQIKIIFDGKNCLKIIISSKLKAVVILQISGGNGIFLGIENELVHRFCGNEFFPME